MNPRSSHSSPPYLLRRPLLLATVFYCLVLIAVDHFGYLGFPSNSQAFHEGFYSLIGIVTGAPQIYADRVSFPLEVNKAALRVTLRGSSCLPFVGDRLQLRGYLELSRPPSNPGEFDYGRYLWRHHLTATLSVKAGYVDLGDSHQFPLRRLAHRMALGITNSLSRCLTPEEAAVMGGLVLGEKPRAFPELESAFQSSGTIHVLVASGFKVAFVIGCWMLIARWGLRLPLNISLAGSIPWAFLYSFVVGGEPPVVRSSIMATIGILGYLLAREDRAYHSLGLAALGILIWDPRSIFDLSFLMSFAAVFGLIHWAPMIASLRIKGRRAPSVIAQLFATSLTAQLWLGPILAVSFHQVPLWAPVANLIAIPLSAAALPAGFALAGLDQLGWGGGRDFIAAACSWIVRALAWTANKFAVALWCPVPAPGWIITYYLVLLCVPGIRRSLLCRWAAGLGMIALLFWPSPGLSVKPGITWLDVGNGSAVVVHGGGGETVLIAGGLRNRGDFDAGKEIILPYLADRGVKRLSAVFLLSPDSIESVKRIMETIPVERFFPIMPPAWSRRFGEIEVERTNSDSIIWKMDEVTILQWSGKLFDLDPRWLKTAHLSAIVVSSKERLPSFYYGVPVYSTAAEGAVFYQIGRKPPISSVLGEFD